LRKTLLVEGVIKFVLNQILFAGSRECVCSSSCMALVDTPWADIERALLAYRPLNCNLDQRDSPYRGKLSLKGTHGLLHKDYFLQPFMHMSYSFFAGRRCVICPACLLLIGASFAAALRPRFGRSTADTNETQDGSGG
jgi:hypothetical protein